MPHLGVSELLVIFMILVLVFGASRLPQLGEGLGKALRGFKRGLSSDDNIEISPAEDGPAGETGGAQARTEGRPEADASEGQAEGEDAPVKETKGAKASRAGASTSDDPSDAEIVNKA